MRSPGDDPDELTAKGRAALAAGQFAQAASILERAAACAPDRAETHFLLGAALHGLRRLPAALAAFDDALARDPSHLQSAQAALGMLCGLGRADEALDRATALLAAHPRDPQVNFNAALVHEAVGDWNGALRCYDAALAAAPAAALPRLNRGLALTKLGRLEEAYENNRALANAQPDAADAHFNLAEVCLATARYAEALAACDHALALTPDHARAALDRGLALAALARFDEAEAALARARALGATPPQSDAGHVASAREIYLVRGYDRLETCDWSERETLLARFIDFVNDSAGCPLDSPALAFRAMMLGLPLPEQLRLARQTADRIAATAPPPIEHRAAAGGRIGARTRIGYVSADLGDHPTSHLAAALFERHDRRGFDVLGYSLSPDDGSAHRRRIAAACDRFLDASDIPTDRLAARIVQDGIDVLVNLNGFTTGHRTPLFAMRPAPVQVSYLAYPATLGATFMDYLIADPIVIPETAVNGYAEAIAWLPVCFQVNDSGETLAPPPTRSDAGLPATGFVFCDFNQHAKITPDVFAAWLRILARVEGSVLWLLDGPGRANLVAHAAATGIAPARVRFAPRLPRAQHMARLQLGDLFLDTRPTNAHTTAADALLAAVPVLTCPGDAFASRVAASLVRAARLGELVVSDLAAYEDAAVSIARDPTRRAAYRLQLRDGRRHLPVFDLAARVRELEWAYTEMVARRRRGLDPVPLRVPANLGGATEACQGCGRPGQPPGERA